MIYESWLDIKQFFDDIRESVESWIFLITTKLLEQGTQIRIGEVNINEIFEKYRKKKHMKVI